SLLSGLTQHLHDPRLIDVGCGTGANLTLLERFGDVIGLDAALLALSFCQQRRHHLLVQASAMSLPFADASADVITALDVLEHLEDDVGALCELHRVLRPGGYLLATVPAYQWLWSEHDEALHHKRRYGARELRCKVEAAGLQIIKLSYAISAVLPIIAAFRFAQRLRPRTGAPKTAHIRLPRPLNQLLVAYLKCEASILRFACLPCGVSLVCVAQKAPLLAETVQARDVQRVRDVLAVES
ncbi:MAG: class I SAM-dependent methyltransferase, partial [Abditibacteriales bacterium]|nr:class I SAM-dependent methyltransferase [Abditibacteriales bacterium]MDW8365939.1 class I SAM-dependent methyltransferase [Abditibacteriales bacterium]